ncbi:Bro-N domain-containing protein [Acidovorax sp. K2F]|uniref:BRO-N domain-containing protein n=1 Tax=Acidovorax sp. K2F TaxID=2978125 RepID=UPI0021B0CAD9|nr:BRO family protein [Acidovorax sp. K2F]MCT6720035.1 BRO family protein [Acidovorax sp. K2F]
MSNIVPHDFEGLQVRTVQIDGKTCFVGKDAAIALGFADTVNALKQHCKGVAKYHPLQTEGGMQNVRVIEEPDLMRLVVNSTLPSAGRFERWVFEEVLPSIRKTGSYSMQQAGQPKPADTSGLPEFRRARALDLAAKTAERILAQLPSLGERARQVVFAKIINPVAGTEVLALPQVTEKHYQAGEVGEMLGITGAMVGRIANQHNLKTPQYGEYRMDKSQHSVKQVESFVYNQAGVDAIKRHMDADRARQPAKKRPAAASVPEPQGALL